MYEGGEDLPNGIIQSPRKSFKNNYLYNGMNSDLFILPDEFGIGSNDTLIYFYSNNKSSVNNKVVFTKNVFCLLQHGVKEVKTAVGKEVITNNELLMLTSGSSLMSESISENGKYEAILVFFGNKTLLDFCTKQGMEITSKASDRSILKVSRDEFLNTFCRSLQLLKKQQTTQINDLKVLEILSYVSISFPELFQQLVSQALTDRTDIKLRQVVELNSNKGLTIEELSFLCNMSVSTFKRHFAAIYHVSPQKYFTKVKMERAKTLLSLQKRPSEIYEELGYVNLPAFSNEFKKYAGLSPKQFQNNWTNRKSS